MNKLVRSITIDEVAAYRTAGVVLLRGILPLAAVNMLRKSIDEAVASLSESPSGYDLSQITRAFEANNEDILLAQSSGQHDVAAIMDHIRASGKPLLFDETARRSGRFLLDTGVTARLREFRRFTLNGPGPQIAASLLASTKVNFFGDQIFVKEPGTRERTAFHQDATYFEIDGEDCCVLWIPVDPATLETGAMLYLRGSHRDGKLFQPNVFISQTPLPGAQGELLPDIERHMEEYDVVHFDAEPGDVIVHHYRTVHGAGGNTSRYQVRRAASIRYIAATIFTFVRGPGRLGNCITLID